MCVEKTGSAVRNGEGCETKGKQESFGRTLSLPGPQH